MKSINTAILGSGGVGKSALTLQFMYGEFVQEYEPTRTDSYKKCVTSGKETVELSIIDTAGQEEYGFLRDSYIRPALGFACVFSLTDRDTYDCIPEFRNTVLRVKSSEAVVLILVGNKLDIVTDDPTKRSVTREEAEKFAGEWGMLYFETSAKTCANVADMFNALVGETLKILGNSDEEGRTKQPHRKKRSKCLLI